MALTITKEGN